MRDTSEGMMEIVDACQEEGGYFVTISVQKEGARKRFRFGVTLSGYKAVCRILESRPFDTMPGLKYRYFWTGSMKFTVKKKIRLGIRCELDQDGKSIDFEVPHTLAANLKWFNTIKTFDEAEHLIFET